MLVACEFSGIVRDAFIARGHDAWSCDLLPSEKGGNHYQENVIDLLGKIYTIKPWDLMIAFAPCTYLANSGVRWLYKDGLPDPERWQKMIEACEFFNYLLGDIPHGKSHYIPRIAAENPIQHKHARALIRKPDQIIQPWQFGHPETKATCLWLKNLPPLVPTNVVEGRKARVHHEPPSENRWKNRSRTLPGIAEAMADQWGQVTGASNAG